MKIKGIAIYVNGILSDKILANSANYDYLIASDIAALKLINNGIMPDLAIGDFDSVSANKTEFIKKNAVKSEFHPHDKDYTDLHLAVIKALELNPASIDIYGATGTRIDHLLAGIFLLTLINKHGVKGRIIDPNNEISIPGNYVMVSNRTGYTYLSVLPLTMSATVSITGSRFNLQKRKIDFGETIGVSNEIREGNCEITVHQGTIILIQSKD